MSIASLEYIHKYMLSLYENDFFSKVKMQIHVGATLLGNNKFFDWKVITLICRARLSGRFAHIQNWDDYNSKYWRPR